MAYYDQLGQFDNTGLSDVSDFVTVNAPLRWRGWLATVIALFVHIALAIIICTFFWMRCKYTCIGQTWKTLSQTVTAVTMPILEMAAKKDDSDIKEELKKVSRKSTRVGIGYITEMGNHSAMESTYEPSGGKELRHDVTETTRPMDQPTENPQV
jgi:hypothetical protein